LEHANLADQPMNGFKERSIRIQAPVVSAQQMHDLESRIFADGMPIAALMEKVGGLIARRIQALYCYDDFPQIGVLAGPGHNGADALVTARELWLKGYDVRIYHPFERCKELTNGHAQFARSLSIPFCDSVEALQACDLLIDGFFGFGLERPLEGAIAQAIQTLNGGSQPIVSIDLPSGLHTDTGQVLGAAVRATHTLCLGLWKLGLVQEVALEWVGQTELIDFDIPEPLIESVLGSPPPIQRLVAEQVLRTLPLKRDRMTHKYRQGHILLVGGSRRYAGSIILSALGAQASGVGMLSIAVPASLKLWVVAKIPAAIVIDCAETPEGAIAELPQNLDLGRFDAIAYGPGATVETSKVLETLLTSDRPLILDADGLNLLAALGVERLRSRSALTVLTPHAGEFRRLFPHLAQLAPLEAARRAAQDYGIVMVHKGACTAIAAPDTQLRVNTDSTPALARGGSGDVLTGLTTGLLAQGRGQSLEAVTSAVWWHSQAGIWAARQHTVLGVNAETLAESLLPALADCLARSDDNDPASV
jgi:ADP-dependent NAD(P)H-hydrate dehydratase / NAD(P)H-hydrate epimerase